MFARVATCLLAALAKKPSLVLSICLLKSNTHVLEGGCGIQSPPCHTEPFQMNRCVGSSCLEKPLSSILLFPRSCKRLLVTMPWQPLQETLFIECVSTCSTWFYKGLSANTQSSVVSPLRRRDLDSQIRCALQLSTNSTETALEVKVPVALVVFHATLIFFAHRVLVRAHGGSGPAKLAFLGEKYLMNCATRRCRN